jgi:creatinine amidohydrolase
MRYGDLTFREIRDRVVAGWLVIIPTGCTEQQGPHLPVDFDTFFAEALMLAATECARQAYAVNALVVPAFPFGPTPEHRNFGSGYIDIPVPLHDALIAAVLESLSDQGFTRLVVWRGCGGHHLETVIAQFNRRAQGHARAFLPDWPYHSSWCRIGDPAVPGGHADSFTTALSLFLRPSSVRRDQIHNPHNAAVNWDDPHLDFAQYSRSGVIGDPTYASADLGARLWQDLVVVTARILRDIAHSSLDD